MAGRKNLPKNRYRLRKVGGSVVVSIPGPIMRSSGWDHEKHTLKIPPRAWRLMTAVDMETDEEFPMKTRREITTGFRPSVKCPLDGCEWGTDEVQDQYIALMGHLRMVHSSEEEEEEEEEENIDEEDEEKESESKSIDDRPVLF